MSLNPFISIIVVTYQAAETLQACIDSVWAQTDLNKELIVIDGASTDATLEIIEANKNKISYFVSEPDAGIYDAMNKGIKQAKGDYLYFLGADDILLPKLHLLTTKMKGVNTIYYGDVRYKNAGIRYGGNFTPWKLVVKNICHQSIFYPASVFKKYNYSLQYPLLADYYLNLQLMADKGFKFEYLKELICEYNEQGSSGKQLDTQFISDKLQLIQSNYSCSIFVYAWFRKIMATYVLRKKYYLK